METKICTVCKKPIDDALVIESTRGPVHPGHCFNYVTDLPVTESNNEDVLTETELLL